MNDDAAELTAEQLPAYVRTLPGWPWPDGDLQFHRITSGLTNVNWRMVDASTGTTYFFKVPGPGTRAFIDRAVAAHAAQVAAAGGIGPAVLYVDDESGIEVSEFLDGYVSSTQQSLSNEESGRQLMSLYRRLHTGAPLPVTKTVFDMIDEHLEQIRAAGRVLRPWQTELVERWLPVQTAYIAAGLEIVPGHNDMLPSNYMVKDGAPMQLIDYDYAANNERAYEPGGIITLYLLDDAVRESLLAEYYGEVTDRERARALVAGIATAMKWGLWALLNAHVRATGDFDFERYGTVMLSHAQLLLAEHDLDRLVAAL